ncbi:MAG: hypothetical protein U0136_15300 [Bdellovibrionota bacterium]
MKVSSRHCLLALGASLLFVSSATSAFAGKPERDRADDIKPKQEEVQKKFKETCGCDVHVNVKFESYATVDDMAYIDQSLDSLSSAASAYCEKEADKKALCESLTEVEFSFAKDESTAKLEGKKISVTTGPHSYASDTAFSTILNKF